MVKAPALGAGDSEFESRHPEFKLSKYDFTYDNCSNRMP